MAKVKIHNDELARTTSSLEGGLHFLLEKVMRMVGTNIYRALFFSDPWRSYRGRATILPPQLSLSSSSPSSSSLHLSTSNSTSAILNHAMIPRMFVAISTRWGQEGGNEAARLVEEVEKAVCHAVRGPPCGSNPGS